MIIGGGPAGLAAAIALRQQRLDAIVVEALTPPIDKACGEGLMPDSLAELSRLGVRLTGGRELCGIHFANRNRGREDLVSAEFRGAKGIGIRRLELHQRLVDRAEELGVCLRWGTRAELRANGEALVGGHPVRYSYLIGADGEASRVRRWVGLEAGHLLIRRLGFRRHYRLPPWSSRVEVHWGRLGQAYVTPVAADEVCVAAVTRHRGLGFDDLIGDIPYLCQALQGAETMGRDRGAVTTTRKLRRVTSGNIALIGDASGTADAITGEGLASTFRQALLLGAALGRDRIAEYEAGPSPHSSPAAGDGVSDIDSGSMATLARSRHADAGREFGALCGDARCPRRRIGPSALRCPPRSSARPPIAQAESRIAAECISLDGNRRIVGGRRNRAQVSPVRRSRLKGTPT